MFEFLVVLNVRIVDGFNFFLVILLLFITISYCYFVIYCYIVGMNRVGSNGGSRNFERGGGRQCISPVVIYRKCTLQNICRLYRGRRFIVKNSEPMGAAAPTAPPFESTTIARSGVEICTATFTRTRYADNITCMLRG